MTAEIVAIYRRLLGFVRGRPLVVALPFAVTLLQQGLYGFGIVPPTDQRWVMIGFTILNTAAMLVVTVHALRWWRFDGDRAATMRLGWRVLWGVIAMMVIQLTDEFILMTLGKLLARATGFDLFVVIALLLWLFISIPLFPWYVAMLADDRDMTLRRAFAAIRPAWVSGFLLVLGALLPLLAIGMVLRLAQMTFDGPLGWAIKFADAALVPLLIVTTASAYFAIYRRAVNQY